MSHVSSAGRGRGGGRGRGSGSGQQPSADGSHSGSSHPSQPSRPTASLFNAAGGAKPLENEYDPARPNDYEAIRAERERLRIEVRPDCVHWTACMQWATGHKASAMLCLLMFSKLRQQPCRDSLAA